MDQETTRSLSRVLEKIDDDSTATDFINAYATTEYSSFHEYLNAFIAERRLVTSEVIAGSGVSTNYVYNILNGKTGNPGRDKIIALCIGAGMTYKEMQRGLEIAGHTPLYPKDERDVRIAVAINTGSRDVTDVNLKLAEYGLEPLDI